MRFDLLTNGMTMTAWTRGVIRVLYGGRESRPQVHVADLVEAYLAIVRAKDLEPGVYNVGATNDNVAALASTIEERLSAGHGRRSSRWSRTSRASIAATRSLRTSSAPLPVGRLASVSGDGGRALSAGWRARKSIPTIRGP